MHLKNKVDIFALVCNLFGLVSSSNRCSPEYCNFAGECEIVGGKPSCTCYEEAFRGEYCELVRNLCDTDENKCTPKDACVPYVGQAICNYGSQRTGRDFERIEHIKPICNYNVRAVYGITEQVVLSFEKLGTDDLQIKISTPTYIIALMTISDRPGPRTLRSLHTNNLTETLQDLGIRRHMPLPYNNASYLVFNATHFTLGANPLSVSIRSLGKNPQLLELPLKVHVVKPTSAFCIPKILFKKGMNEPRPVNVELFTNVQAIVEKRCFPSNSLITTVWGIYNIGENFAYFATGYSNKLLFKIPRYQLWYHHLLKDYPSLILTVQIKFRELNGPWIIARCYIMVIAPAVIADIVGGDYREVNGKNKWLYLDGSRSREPAVSLHAPQQLTYSWFLSSEDGSDKTTLSLDSSSSTINIPTKSLKTDSTNIITLTVVNKFVRSRSHTVTQVVRLVSGTEPLCAEIECISNCKHNFYNAGHVLHLRAVCHNCTKPVTYAWTVNGVDRGQKHRLVTTLATELVGELTIKLNIANRFGTGQNERRLQKWLPPTGGSCVATPETGRECDTVFFITCRNYVSMNNLPMLYVFKLGSIFADVTTTGRTVIHLTALDKLTIDICVTGFPCAHADVHITVEPTTLKGPEVVEAALLDGRNQMAFCVLQKLSVTQTNVHDVLRYFTTIETDRTLTFLGMVNTLELCHNYISAVPVVASLEVLVVLYMLRRVKFTLDYIRKDTEILDISLEDCLNLGKAITNIIEYCLKENKGITHQNYPLWDFNGPFDENYVDWFRFDKEITLRISRYLNTVSLIFNIWNIIGEEATRYVQPEEPYEYTTQHVSYRVQMHESYDHIIYTSNSTYCALEVPLPSVEAHRWMLRTNDLLLHTWCFDYNMFWWAPEAWSPSNAVLAVNILGRNRRSSLRLTSKQWYKLNLRSNEDRNIPLFEDTDEIHNNMIIYKVKLQGPVNMLVRFMNSTAVLRVLVTMNVEPTLINLHDKSCFVPKGSHETNIILKNRCTGEGFAYIAVYKTNSFDTATAKYRYRLSAQECLVWGMRDGYPHWLKTGCYPQNLQQNPNTFVCDNDHLSIFTSKEYVIGPYPIQRIRTYAIKDSLNVVCVLFNCFVMLGAVILLLLANRRLRRKKMNLVRVIKFDQDEVDPSTENVIVHMRTAGTLLGKTTANIKMVFSSNLGRYKIIIFQNPMDPHLVLNTSCMVRVSDQKVELPCELTISHDISGRYPTWCCRDIQVDDLRRDLSYTFPIHRWLKRGEKIRVSCLAADKGQSAKNKIYQMRKVKGFKKFILGFRYYSKFYYTNWFMMQPILGPWRFSDDSCNSYERTCIWICKTVLTISIVFCYYRNTSFMNYFDYEQPLTILSFAELLAISIGSYIATVIFEFCLLHLARL